MSTATLTRPHIVDRPYGVATARTGALRLTRRGRAVIVLIVAAVLVLLAVVLSPGSVASPEPEPPASIGVRVVQPGDTLWELAREIAPRNDPRQIVGQIQELNELSSPVLPVGAQILLPVPA